LKINENVNPPAEPTEPRYVTCYCLQCKGGIEFDANQLRPNEKRAITCPHCKAETIVLIPEAKVKPVVPAKESPAPKPEAVKPPAESAPPARPDEWRVEIPLGGRDGYIGYYEGVRAASFYWEFGGGVVVAIIHIGSPADWSKLYPWAADRRTEILQRVIQAVLQQRALDCKADIDEQSGHIFFRATQMSRPPAGPLPPAHPPAPAKDLPKTIPADDANWQQAMGVACFQQNDFAEAVKFFTQAAEQGNAEAQCYLGFCLMYGQGIGKDEARSIVWFCKAAAQGNAGAEYCLGGAYYLGRGVPKVVSEAVKWWRKAAGHGSADAQINLAGCYENGEGVVQDFLEAFKWTKLAAAHGKPGAQQKCEELLRKMNPAQIAAARAQG
jgi:tetratricopeptide (TPR) repeat protein